MLRYYDTRVICLPMRVRDVLFADVKDAALAAAVQKRRLSCECHTPEDAVRRCAVRRRRAVYVATRYAHAMIASLRYDGYALLMMDTRAMPLRLCARC